MKLLTCAEIAEKINAPSKKLQVIVCQNHVSASGFKQKNGHTVGVYDLTGQRRITELYENYKRKSKMRWGKSFLDIQRGGLVNQ